MAPMVAENMSRDTSRELNTFFVGLDSDIMILSILVMLPLYYSAHAEDTLQWV